MKKQKGMTLIEVMVAMLVLSIAMIGGISFFTSAYRINYSYLESANRLDHALRYVEKLKVQRRNYPTKGYFPNMGGTGFTVFFVDSELYDTFADEPYFYEDYSSDSVQINATVGLNTTNYKNSSVEKSDSKGLKYWQITHYFLKENINSAGEGRGLYDYVENLYPSGDHFKQRLQLGMNSLPANENGYKKVNEVGDVSVYMKYSYDPITKAETKQAYYEFLFSKLIQASKTTYSEDINYYKSNDNYRNRPTQFSISSVSIEKLPQNDTNALPLFPYRYHTHTDSYSYTSGGSSDNQAYGKYSLTTLTESNYIVLKPATELDGGEHTSNLGGEEEEFDSTRFYTKGSGTINNANEISRRSENLAVSTNYQITVPWAEDNLEERRKVETPTAVPYGSDVWFIAKVYKVPSGKETVKSYYKWSSSLGSKGSTLTTNVSPESNIWYGYKYNVTGTIDDWPSLSALGGDRISYVATVNAANGTVENRNRVSKLRRSVYLSVYPVLTKQEAENIITYIEEQCTTTVNNKKKIDLSKVITYMKSLATKGNSSYKGYNIIMIPFNQLYAQNDYSTLCERLD